MLSINQLTKSYGGHTLFSEISFRLTPGDRVGLIGKNGAGKTTLMRLISGEETPDSGLMNDSLRREVQRALSTLTQREADVISLYFGLNGEHSMTLEEIGEKFNLTRERVRQIKEKAIRRLRHTSRSKALKPYLG